MIRKNRQELCKYKSKCVKKYCLVKYTISSIRIDCRITDLRGVRMN